MRKSEDPRYAWADGPRNEAAEGKPIPVATNQPELFPEPLTEYPKGFKLPGTTSLGRPDSNPKSAFGIKKPSMHLIPGTALLYLAKVMALGALKYGAFNWRQQPVAATVYLDAAYRHILAWLDGEDNDPESGAPHIAHAMACYAILLDARAHGTLIDDRPKGGKIAELINDLTVKD